MLRALREQNRIISGNSSLKATYGAGTGKSKQYVYNFFKSYGFRKITENTVQNSWEVVVRDKKKAADLQMALGSSGIQYSYYIGRQPIISGYYDTFQRPEDIADNTLRVIVKELGGYIDKTDEKGYKYSIGFNYKTPEKSDIENALKKAGLEDVQVFNFKIPVWIKPKK